MSIPTRKEQEENIGKYTPHGRSKAAGGYYINYPFHKEYIGDDPDLKGKWALVGFTFVGGATIAQFDDESTGHAYGWWPMKHSDFWEN